MMRMIWCIAKSNKITRTTGMKGMKPMENKFKEICDGLDRIIAQIDNILYHTVKEKILTDTDKFMAVMEAERIVREV